MGSASADSAPIAAPGYSVSGGGHGGACEVPDDLVRATSSAAPACPPAWREPGRPLGPGRGVACSLILNTRVDEGVAEIDNEVNGDQHRGKHEDAGLHDGEVALIDGAEGELTDARPREDLLDNDGPAEEGAELEADVGD